MPYRLDSRGRYDVSVCVRGTRLHRRLPAGSSARDAKLVESELRIAAERDAGRRQVVIPGDPALTAVMAGYVAAAKHLRSPDTAIHHAQRIGRWVEQYRASQARQCAAHIVTDMRGHYADATINRSLGTLKRALRMAWERGETSQDWSAQVRRLAEHNARDVYLTVDEVGAIAAQASESVRACVWIALLTGCRRGEILALRAEDIQGDTLLVRAGNTKTLRTRTVPIIAALRPWLAYVPVQLNAEGLKSGFRRAREAAGRPDVHFHDLRHSCATILLSLGTPLDVVRDVLGHTTIRTTERYAHALVHRQRAALEGLGALADLHQASAPASDRAA